MMNADQQRAWVGKLYPGEKWRKKVSKMSDGTIFAIYSREKNKTPKPKKPPEPPEEKLPF